MRIKINLTKQAAIKLLLSLMLISSFSTIAISQTVESTESPVVSISEQAMEQIVRRVLTWYFKPRNQAKVIYLAKQELQQSWLPTIKNIEFRLLSEEEIKQNNADIYFFTKPEYSENSYRIGFAFGAPYCSHIGDSWYFRISNQRVRLWQDGSGFGADCGHSSFS